MVSLIKQPLLFDPYPLNKTYNNNNNMYLLRFKLKFSINNQPPTDRYSLIGTSVIPRSTLLMPMLILLSTYSSKSNAYLPIPLIPPQLPHIHFALFSVAFTRTHMHISIQISAISVLQTARYIRLVCLLFIARTDELHSFADFIYCLSMPIFARAVYEEE